LVNEDHDNWDELVKFVVQAYNATPHASTRYSLNTMVFGSELVLPSELVHGVLTGSQADNPCRVTFVEQLRQALLRAHRNARSHLQQAARQQKLVYDVGNKSRIFKPGELVYRYYVPKASTKLTPSWDGPFKIISKSSDTVYLIEGKNKRRVRYHVDYLKPADPIKEEVTEPEIKVDRTRQIRARLGRPPKPTSDAKCRRLAEKVVGSRQKQGTLPQRPERELGDLDDPDYRAPYYIEPRSVNDRKDEEDRVRRGTRQRKVPQRYQA